MARPDKAAAVAELVDSFQESTAAVLTEYRGLTVKQLQELRTALGENATYSVVKNTLTQIAAKQAGVDGVDNLLLGPTAIAFVKGDVVEAAKGLRDFARTNPALIIKGGYFEGKSLEAAEIAKLADLESREVLLGKLAGAMLASLSQAVYLLNAPLTQAARVVAALQEKAEQDPSILAGGAGTPAAPAPEAVDQSDDQGDTETVEEIAADTAAEPVAEVSAAEPTTEEPATEADVAEAPAAAEPTEA
jgi:large subunit ribosomal protein L10